MTRVGGSRLTILLTVSAVVTVLAVGGWWWFAHRGDELDRLYAQAKAKGFPFTRNEVYPPCPFPPTENGAAKLEKVFSEFRIEGSKNDAATLSLLKMKYRSLVPTDRRNLLATFAKSLAAAREALRNPHIYFDHDYDQGPLMLLPELYVCKSLTAAFLCAAIDEAANGHKAAAEKDIDNALRIAKLLRGDPLLPALHMSNDARFSFDTALQDLASIWKDDVKALRHLLELTATLPQDEDFMRYMRGEFYLQLAVARNMPAYGGLKGFVRMSDAGRYDQTLSPDGLIREGLPKAAADRRQLVEIIKVFLKLQGVFDRYKTEDEVKDHISSAFSDIDHHMNLDRAIVGLLSPAPWQEYAASILAKGHAACEKAFLKVMIFRATKGHLPSSPDEADALIDDPYFDTTLEYRHSGDTFTVGTPGPVMFPSWTSDKPEKKRHRILLGYPPGG